MIKSIVPIFISSDLDITEKFFSEVLNFKTDGKHEDYLTMRNSEIEIHFSKILRINKKKNNCACYLRTDYLDGLYKKCSELDCLHPNGKLSDNPWGREFAIRDPDWNLIKITGK
jgi:hypothetical protein